MNDGTKQKIEGEIDQAKGELKQQTGNEAEGAWDKTKGKVKEEIGEAREEMDKG